MFGMALLWFEVVLLLFGNQDDSFQRACISKTNVPLYWKPSQKTQSVSILL